jgi:hypothetical protein
MNYETVQNILTILIEICGFIAIAVLPTIYIIETNIKAVKSWGNPPEVTQTVIPETPLIEQIPLQIKNDAPTERQEKTKLKENLTSTKTPKSKTRNVKNEQPKPTTTRKKRTSKKELINNTEPLAS